MAVEVKAPMKDAVTPAWPTELKQALGDYVMTVASSNRFFDGAHALVYRAGITVERTKTNEKGVEWFATNFLRKTFIQRPRAMTS